MGFFDNNNSKVMAVSCIRCHAVFEANYENSIKNNQNISIPYYWRCPYCGARINDDAELKDLQEPTGSVSTAADNQNPFSTTNRMGEKTQVFVPNIELKNPRVMKKEVLHGALSNFTNHSHNSVPNQIETKYGMGVVGDYMENLKCPKCHKNNVSEVTVERENTFGMDGANTKREEKIYYCFTKKRFSKNFCGFNGHLALFGEYDLEDRKKKHKSKVSIKPHGVGNNLMHLALEILGMGILILATGTAPLFDGVYGYIFYIFCILFLLVEIIHTVAPNAFIEPKNQARSILSNIKKKRAFGHDGFTTIKDETDEELEDEKEELNEEEEKIEKLKAKIDEEMKEHEDHESETGGHIPSREQLEEFRKREDD